MGDRSKKRNLSLGFNYYSVQSYTSLLNLLKNVLHSSFTHGVRASVKKKIQFHNFRITMLKMIKKVLYI